MKEEKEIFVVEDSKIIGSLICHSIEKYLAFNATPFYKPELMLDVLGSKKPAAFIIDYYLSTEKDFNLNGVQLAGMVRQIHGELPIILISGTSNPKIIQDIKAFHPTAFIHKDEVDVFDKINQTLLKYCA